MPKAVEVDYENLGPGAKEQVRQLYAVRGSAKPPRASFNERSAPARARIAERRSKYRAEQKKAAQGRTARNRTIRGVRGRAFRTVRGVHRAAGNPGGTIAGIVGLFIGAGVLVALVRNPALVTVPLNFIGAAVKAMTGLLNGPKAAPAPAPAQNVSAA